MNYSADRFFDKYITKEGRSLAWLAQQLGYSATYVRKVSCHMTPVSAGFVGRAVTILNEDPSIFLDNIASIDVILAEKCNKSD